MNKWINSTIGQLTTYQRAGGTPSTHVDEYYGGDIPFVTIEDITNSSRFLDKTEKQLSAKGLANSAAWLIKEPHILYSMYATVGKPVINRVQCATNQAIIALKESPLIDQTYLYYQLLFIRPQVYKFTAQTTQSNLNAGAVKKLPIAYPKDIGQQRKIAAILTSVDTEIEKTESLIVKYQQIKAGLMHDLFTRGVTANGKLRPPRDKASKLYKETPIGWIPKEWDCRKFGKILHESGGYLQTGPFGSQLHAHEYTLDGIPVVMPQNIEDGKIFTHAIARIPESRAKFLARHRVKLGDIIIARRGELSRAVAISQRELGWVCGTGCFLLRLIGSKLDPHFFSYAYRHDIVQRQIEGLAVGSTMPSLNNSVINSLYFPYLTEDEQHRISERLEAQDNILLSLVCEKEKLEKQKYGLMHDLLTGKVPVKVEREPVEMACG